MEPMRSDFDPVSRQLPLEERGWDWPPCDLPQGSVAIAGSSKREGIDPCNSGGRASSAPGCELWYHEPEFNPASLIHPLAMAMKGEDTLKREQAILEEIIRYYMDRHEAISARTLSKISRLALSPTTIRNLMEDLSEEGFLTTEGVSRGRIPTQKAFAIHVTQLGDRPPPTPADTPNITAMEEGEPPLLPSAVHQIGRYLEQHSGCAVCISLPRKDLYPLDWVRFSSIPYNQVLVSMRTLFGDLWSKVLISSDPFPEELLREVGRFINENYRGRTLEAIRDDIMAGEPKDLLADMPSLGAAFRMLRKAFEWNEEPKHRVWGMDNLYRMPECQDSELLVLIHKALEDPGFLTATLERARRVGGGWISLGTETGYAGLEMCALVGYPFAWREWRGLLGILGPMRMNHANVLGLAATAGQALGEHLEDSVAKLGVPP